VRGGGISKGWRGEKRRGRETRDGGGVKEREGCGGAKQWVVRRRWIGIAGYEAGCAVGEVLVVG